MFNLNVVRLPRRAIDSGGLQPPPQIQYRHFFNSWQALNVYKRLIINTLVNKFALHYCWFFTNPIASLNAFTFLSIHAKCFQPPSNWRHQNGAYIAKDIYGLARFCRSVLFLGACPPQHSSSNAAWSTGIAFFAATPRNCKAGKMPGFAVTAGYSLQPLAQTF